MYMRTCHVCTCAVCLRYTVKNLIILIRSIETLKLRLLSSVHVPVISSYDIVIIKHDTYGNLALRYQLILLFCRLQTL